MISFGQKGDFSKVTKFLSKAKNMSRMAILHRYAREGVSALSSATPVDTGKTAASWYYKIKDDNGVIKISYYNSNVQNGVPIAIIIHYGHATGTGGWVEGRDYINKAIQPVFDRILQAVWREVTKV